MNILPGGSLEVPPSLPGGSSLAPWRILPGRLWQQTGQKFLREPEGRGAEGTEGEMQSANKEGNNMKVYQLCEIQNRQTESLPLTNDGQKRSFETCRCFQRRLYQEILSLGTIFLNTLPREQGVSVLYPYSVRRTLPRGGMYCIRTLPRGGMYWEIHPPRTERFCTLKPKGKA